MLALRTSTFAEESLVAITGPAPTRWVEEVNVTAPIEVIEVRRLTGDGSLRAFAKIRLGSVVIHSCRVIQQPGQKAWVALPQVPGRAKADGSGAGWYPVVEITSKDLMARVRDAVLQAWAAGS